jgi:hypothetical protein
MSETKAKDEVKADDFLEGYAGQGYENFSANSYQVPFLKIAQSLSPEVDDHKPEYINGLEKGGFFNSLTKKNYGKKIKLIPLKQKEMWLEYEPNRGAYKGAHDPGSIPTTGDQFDGGLKTANGNDIVDTLIFYCLVADEIGTGPIVFSLYGSGFTHGKTWNSMIMTCKTASGKVAPYFGSVWELETIYNQNDNGAWYQIGAKKLTNVKRVRGITQEELTDHILPAREILKDVSKQGDFSQLAQGEGQKQLTDTSKSDF